jgi:hypothetical protein
MVKRALAHNEASAKLDEELAREFAELAHGHAKAHG